MAAVRSAHVNTENHEIYDKQLTPHLGLLMQGIHKEKSKTTPQRTHLPITLEIMEQIRVALSKTSKDYKCILLWAVCCTAFFGLLRVSEFTVPSTHRYDPDFHLSQADVTLDNRQAPSLEQLHIKQSKTDPFRNRSDEFLGRTHKKICPVEAILAYLTVRGNQPGQLFALSDNTTHIRCLFAPALKSILITLNLDPYLYNTHSFRIGAATAVNTAGISELDIKAMGRWQSDAHQRYIRTSPEQLASLSDKLASSYVLGSDLTSNTIFI